LFRARARAHRFSRAMARGFALREDVKKLARPETIVCRCEDVPLGELKKYDSWRDAKLQTRCGMGACQGRICGGATRTLFGWDSETARPPVFPIEVGTFREVGTGAEEAPKPDGR
jgi:D-hydroxyproline dehydrogenase subunit alpha